MRSKRFGKPSYFSAALGLLLLASCAYASAQPPPITEALRLRIRDAALRASLDPALVEAVVRAESNYKRKAKSHAGAMGLMQVIPGTADACEIHDAYNTADNLMGASDCLRKLVNRYRGDVRLALAAYNAGPGAVAKYKGIPPYPETQDYVRKVMRFYEENREARKKPRVASRRP